MEVNQYTPENTSAGHGWELALGNLNRDALPLLYSVNQVLSSEKHRAELSWEA